MKYINKRYFIFLLFLFFFIPAKSVQAAYDLNTVAANIEQSKTWVVKFNKEVNPSTITSGSVLVKDSKGNMIAVDAILRGDNKSISISPKTKLDFSKEYTLVLKNAIKSKSGEALNKEINFRFKIKDDPMPYVVCIDPGHGGSDNGTVSTTAVKEKDVTLSVGLKVGKILEDNGIKVVYTRNSDTVAWNKDNDLKARFDVSNNNNANLFLTLHCNSVDNNTTATGVETWYTNNDPLNVKFAEAIQGKLASTGTLANRGIKVGLPAHEILRGTLAPALMVQLGFLTNPNDATLVGSTGFQEASAKAIAEGIINSISAIDKNKILSIKYINNINNTVEAGQGFSLPLSIPAVMSDGTTKNVNVIWDSKSANTSVPGTYTFKGTIGGYSSLVTLTLKVNAKEVPQEPGITIAIDPGHGIGRDRGADGISTIEDNITLPVALKLGPILKAKGINIVYTRTSDESSNPLSVTESLQRRCDTANQAKAKYLISIHCNAFDQSSASGTEVLYETSDPESKALAAAIQRNLVSALGTSNRGLKDGSWLYLSNNSNSTVVLAELGFITNPNDENKLKTSEGQQKAANAIAKGVFEFLGIN